MHFSSHIAPKDSVSANAVMSPSLNEKMQAPHMVYLIDCWGPREDKRNEYNQMVAEAKELRAAGFERSAISLLERASAFLEHKWTEEFKNTVTNEGRNDVLDQYFKGSAYTAAWYLGLKGTGSAAAGDTLASHAGWSEVTPYTGNRKSITWGTTSSQSNTATAVSFAITGTATVAGAFITTALSGTSGILYSAGDFAASRSVASGDTLNVTPTVSD